MIAQTYDGANVMRGHIAGVQTKVQEVYRNAHYVHCYAHQLNLILQKAAMATTRSKIFFADLDFISTYLSRSPERLRI